MKITFRKDNDIKYNVNSTVLSGYPTGKVGALATLGERRLHVCLMEILQENGML